jgi:hypothetical protein
MKVVLSTFLFLLVRYTEALGDFYQPGKKDGTLFLQDTSNHISPLYYEMNVTMEIRSQFEIDFVMNTPADVWTDYDDSKQSDLYKKKTQDLFRFGKTKISYDVNGELAVLHYVDGTDKLFTTTKFKKEGGSSVKHVKITQLKNAEGKYVFTIFWQAGYASISETITVENSTPHSEKNGRFERYPMIQAMRTCCETSLYLGCLRISTHDCMPENYFDGHRCRRYPIIRRKYEFTPEENVPIATFRLRKQYELEFEFSSSAQYAGHRSLIRVGMQRNSAFYGDRVPAIYINKEGKLNVRRDSNGNKDQDFYSDSLPLNQWSKFRITQLLTEDGKYKYQVYMGNKVLLTEIEEKPIEVLGAMLYVAGAWNSPAHKSKIRNLRYVSHDCPFGHYLDDNSAECKKRRKS